MFCSVEARDERGNTALSVAAWKNHMELAEMMVEEFKAKVDSRDSKMWTPLCIAAFHSHVDMVRYLLSVREHSFANNSIVQLT